MTFCSADIILAQSNEDLIEVYTRTPNRGLNPDECAKYKVTCTCYAPDALKKIYRASVERDKCQAELYEKSLFIQERLVTWGAGQPVAFWQTPSFIIGGTVVTIGVTAGVTAWLLSQ